MGYKEEEGIIPRFSNELFTRIKEMSDASEKVCASPLTTLPLMFVKTSFKVEVSYFEIYSERIYDLLLPSKSARNKVKVNTTRSS